MSEKEKRDSNELITMLKELPIEDRIQVQGVIAGMMLARKTSDRTVAADRSVYRL